MELTIEGLTGPSCAAKLCHILESLDLEWQFRPLSATGVGFAAGNVWSRAARRKKEQSHSSPSTGIDNLPLKSNEGDIEPALGFKVNIAEVEDGGVAVKLRWLQGQDEVLFESFCGMLKRQLNSH